MSEETKRDPKLSPAGLTPAEHVLTVYSITAEYGITKDDLLNPSYWGHVSQRLRAKDIIRVHTEDCSYYAELLVISADKTWAKVVLMNYIDLNAASKIPLSVLETIKKGYEIQFRGQKKWSVVRNTDRAVLVELLHTKEQATEWLSVHLNAQGIAA